MTDRTSHRAGRTVYRSRRGALTAVLSAALLPMLLAPPPAGACSCMPPGPPRAELERSTAVFVGEVLSVEPLDAELEGPAAQFARLRVTLTVERVFKGLAEPGDQVVLTTAASSAACGFPFEQERRYLVYASGGEEVGGALTASLCSRTRPLEEAEEDLRELEGLRDPA